MKVGYQVSDTNEPISAAGVPVRIFAFNIVTSGTGPSDLTVYNGEDSNGALVLTLTVAINGGALFSFPGGIAFKGGCAISSGGDIQAVTTLYTKI